MIKREITGFLITGSVAFVADFGVFNLMCLSGLNAQSSNAFGILCSAIVSYLGNTLFSFSHRRGKKSRLIPRFILASASYLIISQALTVLAFQLVDSEDLIALNFAKISVVAVMLIARFLSFKFFVYKE